MYLVVHKTSMKGSRQTLSNLRERGVPSSGREGMPRQLSSKQIGSGIRDRSMQSKYVDTQQAPRGRAVGSRGIDAICSPILSDVCAQLSARDGCD